MLPEERISAVQTGGCPHTAIRDDIAANLEAVSELEAATGPLDLVFVESGGDNLTAIFSPALADVQAFVIDVAAGDDIPRKGGPGITRADLLVINKTDLRRARRQPTSTRWCANRRRAATACRCEATSLRAPAGAARVASWVRARIEDFAAHGHLHSSAEGAPDHHHDHVALRSPSSAGASPVCGGARAWRRRSCRAARSYARRSCPCRPARSTATMTASGCTSVPARRW